MTFKNNRAPLLSNIKLYASFRHHMWIQTGVTVRKRLSWVVTSVTWPLTLTFAWTLPWSVVTTSENFMWYDDGNIVNKANLRDLKAATSLESGNAQFGSKSMIFFSRVTLQFDRWPWKTIGHLFYATSSFVYHFVVIGELKLELQSRNA